MDGHMKSVSMLGKKRRITINSTKFSYFILSAYVDTLHFQYLYFMIILLLYVSIVCSNVLLIVVICVNRSLHEPMYMFLCSLFVNELYGSTGLFPFLLSQILSDVHTVSAPLCFLQVFSLYSYASVEFFNLAVMSYDRYLAICCPLRYHVLMTRRMITKLISLTWLYALVLCVVPPLLSAPLQLCGNIIDRVYCDNHSFIKMACSDATLNNIYGLTATFVTFGCSVALILYSYIRILKVCFCGSKQTRQKAVSTCTPQLASMLNFSCGIFFEITQNRFDMRHVPNMLRIFLSLYWLTCQPLFNPVLYGLNLSKIRITCKSVFGKMQLLVLQTNF